MKDMISNAIAGIGITDAIDIAIVAFVIYKILAFIRETRAEQLVKGLLVLGVAFFASDIFNLYTLNWILQGTMTLGVVALVVVFQPELRRGLEYVGRSKFVRPQFAHVDKDEAKAVTAAIIKAIDYFSVNKIGCLLIMEREISLNDISETGTSIDSLISTEMLGNIFYEGAPLHDGATIIRGTRILSAGCVLPLTQDKSLSKELGTRHRAAIGITENSDSIALVVSEETGIISMALEGKLQRFLDIKTVEKTLLNLYFDFGEKESVKVPFIEKFWRAKKNDEQK